MLPLLSTEKSRYCYYVEKFATHMLLHFLEFAVLFPRKGKIF